MKEEEKWMEWLTKHITASQLLNLGPTFVKHVCISAGGDTGTAMLHNSQDASGEIKLAITAILGTHFGDDFEIPVFFGKGLYVVIGGTTPNVTIQYKNV